MFVRNNRVYYSASDLKAAVECEWALMRKLDSKLGRIEAVDEVEDAMLARASILGGEHEARALANYKTQFPRHGTDHRRWAAWSRRHQRRPSQIFSPATVRWRS